jgi:hypothetical protein
MRVIECGTTLSRMLADAKLVPDRLDPWQAWKVFKAFMQLPVECEGDAASFQCSYDQDEAGGERFFVEFIRQCSATEDGGDTPVIGVGIELTFAPERILATDDHQIWSYDYESLAAFAAHVESLPEFQAAMNEPPLASDVWMREV